MRGQDGPDSGSDKLLLPWNGATVIDQVLQAWTQSTATHVVAIVRQDNLALQAACGRWPAIDLVTPDQDPPDMKRSVQLGLEHIIANYAPLQSDRWLLAPADLPTLRTSLIDRVVQAGARSENIVGPRFGSRHGHPIAIPWALTPTVFQLDQDKGINSLVKDHPVQWLDLPPSEYPEDIDTPEDYRRAVEAQQDS